MNRITTAVNEYHRNVIKDHPDLCCDPYPAFEGWYCSRHLGHSGEHMAHEDWNQDNEPEFTWDNTACDDLYDKAKMVEAILFSRR